MSLVRYALFRLVLVVPVLVGILAITFVITHVLPSDPAVAAAGPLATEDQVKAIRHELGLDRSIWHQFVSYFGDLFRGDLGTSVFTKRPALNDIADGLPSTLELITVAIVVAFVLAVGLAMLTADRKGVADVAGRAYGTVGTALPDFFFALILVLVFYTTLQWLPGPLGQAGTRDPEIARPTGAYFLDAIIAGNGAAVWAGFKHLILPVATLAIIYSAPIYRVARASIEESRRALYVDYATMMGGTKRYVWRQVVENSVPPILTISGIIYGLLLGGAVLVEQVFSWGGFGQYAVKAVQQNDFFSIQGVVLVAAVFSVLVYLAVDLTHAALDPRVRKGL